MIIFATFVLLLIQAATSADNNYFEVGPRHGGNGGGESEVVCPFGGAITGVNYRAGELVDQIEFVCTSSQGKTTFGPYGGSGGAAGSLHCPPGQYISSFYGRSGERVDRLGVRCRPQNDMKSIGTDKGAVGGNGGASFDESALSEGYRIMSIKVRSGNEVDSLQVTYGNIKISGDLCTTCTNYRDEWAPAHGGSGGAWSTVFCPAEGVITAIKYRAGSQLDSITFVCTSAIGISELGPFGGNGGAPGEEKCQPGSYISSIHGRSGELLDSFGIQCRKVGDAGSGARRDAHGGSGGLPFDDSSYTTNQRRPVQFRIRSGSFIDMVQVKYGNMPVSMNCKVSNIVVTDKSIIAKDDGYAVIGLATGSTCSSQTQSLQLSQAATVEETTGVETSEASELNWSKTLSIGYTFGVDALGIVSQMSLELSQSVGGSQSWSNTRSKSTTTSSTSTVGTQVNYEGPGACLVIGTMKRYKVEQNSLPVLYQFKCEGGVASPQQGTIKLSSTTFDQASFLDFSHKFENAAECPQKARKCVSSIQAGTSISDPWSIKKDFDKCFI